jgi:hypothetical protein
MVVHHVGDFREQQAVRFQYALGLLQKWRTEIAQVPIALLYARAALSNAHRGNHRGLTIAGIR